MGVVVVVVNGSGFVCCLHFVSILLEGLPLRHHLPADGVRVRVVAHPGVHLTVVREGVVVFGRLLRWARAAAWWTAHQALTWYGM